MSFSIPSCGSCKFDKRFLCGVLKSLDNCPYPDLSLCQADQAIAQVVVGSEPSPGEIILRYIRFRRATVPRSSYQNVCPECGIFWDYDINQYGCIVCKQGR